jgi:large subunit ribosomal protein L10
MPSAVKQEQLSEIKSILSAKANFVVTTYSGLNVEQMLALRAKIRDSDSSVKVIKNNLFKIALKDSPVHSAIANSFEKELKGPIAVTFVGGEFPAAAKAIVEFAKTNDKVVIKSGVMDGQFLNANDVKDIATLPSRDELLAIIARGFNTPATQIASGMNQIIASLARAIKAVGEKNGG